MTQATKQVAAFAVVASGFLFLGASVGNAQTDHQLPPTLRAAQQLDQHSGSMIDQLLSDSEGQATGFQNDAGGYARNAAGNTTGNGLRSAGRPTAPSHGFSQSQQPTLRQANAYSAADQRRVTGTNASSVRPVTYQRPAQPIDRAVATGEPSGSKSDAAWDQILRSSSAAANEILTEPVAPIAEGSPEASFIDTEAADPSASDKSTAALIKKISINLMIVLGVAFAFLLLVKQWQKGKSGIRTLASETKDTLNVSQVVPLTNGASLHVVQGNDNKFLVAIDASGIKSVNVLNGTSTFDETLKQVETRQQRREATRETRRETLRHEPIDPKEDASAIDEKLIKMLLQRSPAAA